MNKSNEQVQFEIELNKMLSSLREFNHNGDICKYDAEILAGLCRFIIPRCEKSAGLRVAGYTKHEIYPERPRPVTKMSEQDIFHLIKDAIAHGEFYMTEQLVAVAQYNDALLRSQYVMSAMSHPAPTYAIAGSYAGGGISARSSGPYEEIKVAANPSADKQSEQ